MVNSRQKGARGERELAKWLTDHGYPARRGQQYCGANGDADVICDSLKDIHIESKRVERLQLYQALEQAASDCKEDDIPVVFHKKNGKDWVCILSAEHFLHLFALKELAD